MTVEPSIFTTATTLVFAFFYLFYLLYISSKRKIEIYDGLLLSLVAIIPGLFVLFPEISTTLAEIYDIDNTYTVWFGLLIAVLYILMIRLTIKVNNLNKLNIKLLQEISILSVRKKREKK